MSTSPEKLGIVAFDIDGTLTRKNVRDIYKQLHMKDTLYIGIITTSLPSRAVGFAQNNGLEYDFNKSAVVKARAMKQLERKFSEPDLHAYVGDRISDRLFSRMSGWKYFPPEDAHEILFAFQNPRQIGEL